MYKKEEKGGNTRKAIHHLIQQIETANFNPPKQMRALRSPLCALRSALELFGGSLLMLQCSCTRNSLTVSVQCSNDALIMIVSW